MPLLQRASAVTSAAAGADADAFDLKLPPLLKGFENTSSGETPKVIKTWTVNLHIFSAVLHVALCAAMAWRSSTVPSLPVVRLRNNAGFPYVPNEAAVEKVFSFNPLVCLAAIEAITAAFEVAYYFAVSGGKWYYQPPQPFDEWKTNELRWVEYGITATLGTLANAVGVGANDFGSFSGLVAIGVALQFMGYATERLPTKRSALAAFFVGVGLQASTYVVINVARNMNASAPVADDSSNDGAANDCSADGTSDRWQEQIAVYMVYYSSFGLVAFLYLWNRAYEQPTESKFPLANFQFVEFSYATLSTASKSALAIIVFASVAQYLEHFAPCDSREPETLSVAWWDAVRYAGMVVPGAAAVVAIVALSLQIKTKE